MAIGPYVRIISSPVMPIVEFVWWLATDEYLNDFHSRVKPTLDYVQNADGCTSIFFGREEENPATVWIVVVWKTIEHHQVMMNRPDYPDMVAKLKPSFRDGQMNMCHVELNNDTSVAFTAPMTELLTIILTENQNRERFDVLLGEVLQGHGNHEPMAWGETQEDPGKFILVRGCDSVQVHEEFGKLSMAPVEQLSKVHVRMSKYVAEK